MKLYKNTLIIIAILLFESVYAQQEPNYTLYRYTMNVINPAYAGADGTANLTSNFRSQWISVIGAPETQSFFYSRPLGEKVGIGLSIVSDQVFIENQTSFNIDFSYKLQVSETADLFLGLKAGGSTYDIDRGNLTNIGLPDDPALGNIDSGFRPNFGAGAYLMHDKYFVSLSVPRILSTERLDEADGRVTQATQEAHIYISGGYNFRISDNTEFRPSTMVRYVDGTPLSVDLTGAFRFYNRFEVGLAYRTDEAFGGLMMINLADWLDIGYAYESSTRDEISNNSNGTHEVFIRFVFSRTD
ncbi:PorP/SprF family type IX secretion system membrane protein [Winogradskyella alexanderae]|uniref:Type IX secretion system membrane protein PorP/SprF n=1 Tax=Winogradskyella alexanderae TaxID=2877123 RepID=A0ABS7XQE0_9FLAO|nr:type IX secretion system membrane protein PorP/SprF [Winogradskyella alexanderae]MCA0131066.1 type IX secretion system membrane protein PorP/SprF [Winogradskyella alexanderae]